MKQRLQYNQEAIVAIELYTFTTPNGRKPAILLEELAVPYTAHRVNISKGEQHQPEFLAISPNGKIPALVDREADISVFESGAILIYLAEKYGKFLPTETKERIQVISWLMFQMASVGPMFGQLGHFRRSAPEKIAYAIERYEKETLRLFGVLDGRLAENEFICGEYSIADMATYPWVAAVDYLEVSLENHPSLQRWVGTMRERPAVQRGMKVPA